MVSTASKEKEGCDNFLFITLDLRELREERVIFLPGGIVENIFAYACQNGYEEKRAAYVFFRCRKIV